PLPERRAGRERQQMGEEIAGLVEQLDRARLVRHGDVDVQAEDEERPRELLQLFDDALVARAGGDDLVLPARERMRAGGGDAQTDALGARRQLAPDPADLLVQLADVGADLGADFDDRLVQLALDLIAERRRRRAEQLRDVRAELPRVGIDDLEFFFDADREGVAHQAMISYGLPPRCRRTSLFRGARSSN